MLEPFLGVQNLADVAYSGAVRLNALGGRFFEPAPGINVTVVSPSARSCDAAGPVSVLVLRTQAASPSPRQAVQLGWPHAQPRSDFWSCRWDSQYGLQ